MRIASAWLRAIAMIVLMGVRCSTVSAPANLCGSCRSILAPHRQQISAAFESHCLRATLYSLLLRGSYIRSDQFDALVEVSIHRFYIACHVRMPDGLIDGAQCELFVDGHGASIHDKAPHS